MSDMKISQNGIDFICQWEGTGKVKDGKLMPYRDVAGYWTIGYGHLLTKSELTSQALYIAGKRYDWKKGLTFSEAKTLMDQDLDKFENYVNGAVKVPLTQNQFDTIVSFSYNVGTGALGGSTLLKKLNSGKYDEVPRELMRWTRSGGRHWKGLVNRRKAEAELWLKK